MKLLVFHPQLLGRSCHDCQQWLFDERHQKVLRAGKCVPRPPGSPTPCWKCPKKNPEHGARLERALPQAARCLDLYYQVQGSAGACLSPAERGDAIVRRNLGIAHAVLEIARGGSAAVKQART